MSTHNLPTFLSLLLVFLASACSADIVKKLTDDDVAQLLIQQSIASYSGACACPYSKARNGSNCGKRSAYSKPGGASPLCYRSDVSESLIKSWRSKKNN